MRSATLSIAKSNDDALAEPPAARSARTTVSLTPDKLSAQLTGDNTSVIGVYVVNKSVGKT
jgi:hypothetical protein